MKNLVLMAFAFGLGMGLGPCDAQAQSMPPQVDGVRVVCPQGKQLCHVYGPSSGNKFFELKRAAKWSEWTYHDDMCAGGFMKYIRGGREICYGYWLHDVEKVVIPHQDETGYPIEVVYLPGAHRIDLWVRFERGHAGYEQDAMRHLQDMASRLIFALPAPGFRLNDEVTFIFLEGFVLRTPYTLVTSQSHIVGLTLAIGAVLSKTENGDTVIMINQGPWHKHLVQ